MKKQSIQINTEYIKLSSLLKLANITSSGGEAKILIQNGQLSVNGEICFQRGKKLYPGDTVTFSDINIVIE